MSLQLILPILFLAGGEAHLRFQDVKEYLLESQRVFNSSPDFSMVDCWNSPQEKRLQMLGDFLAGKMEEIKGNFQDEEEDVELKWHRLFSDLCYSAEAQGKEAAESWGTEQACPPEKNLKSLEDIGLTPQGITDKLNLISDYSNRTQLFASRFLTALYDHLLEDPEASGSHLDECKKNVTKQRDDRLSKVEGVRLVFEVVLNEAKEEVKHEGKAFGGGFYYYSLTILKSIKGIQLMPCDYISDIKYEHLKETFEKCAKGEATIV